MEYPTAMPRRSSAWRPATRATLLLAAGCLIATAVFPRTLSNRLETVSRFSAIAPKAALQHHPRGYSRLSGIVRRAAMKLDIEEEKASDCRIRLKITVPADEVQKLANRCIKDISKDHDIPGFRPGKPVPRQIIDQWVKKEDLHKQMVTEILNATVPAALKGYRKIALDGSEDIESNVEDLVKGFSEKKELSYFMGVETLPTISWKQSYKGLEVEIESENVPEKNAKMVEKAIMNVRKKMGELDNASDREVQKGDMVMMSYMGVDSVTNEPLVELGGQRAKQFDTEDDTIVTGFMDNIIGTKVDEIKEFELTFPNTFTPAKFRGTTAKFKAMVHQIFSVELAPEDEKLAKELVPDAKNMEEARAFLAEAVEKEAETKETEAVEEALIAAIGQISECELPNILIQENGQQMYGASLMEFQQSGKISPGVLNSLMTPELVGRYIRDNRPEIETRVRTMLAFEAILEEEGLQLTPAQIEAETKAMAQQLTAMGVQEYDEDRVREQATELLSNQVVLDLLKENMTLKKV